MRPQRVGLVVNPVAGLGAKVGLKGTDGVVAEALARGARPVAPGRAAAFLRAVQTDVTWLTAAGDMGDDALAAADLSGLVVFTPSASKTTASDTQAAAAALAAAGVDLIVFVGGDGTAADVAAGLPAGTPALGVPSGSKMFSAVFADTPAEAAAVIDHGFDATSAREVLDIDEAAYRDGAMRVALKGTLAVPTHAAVQGGKDAGNDDEVEQASLGRAVAETLEPGVSYVLGAGGTMQEVKAALGVAGTLLGLDVVRDGALVTADATEADLLAAPLPLRVIVSPIGHQGFVLGRGNLAVSPEVLRRAGGTAAVTVVATPTKLQATPALKVDSGDPELDGAFPRFVRVVTGFNTTRLARLGAAPREQGS